MTIGEKIKELRKKNDMTQEKLADYLLVSYQAVSKWECGLSSPDLSLIEPLTKLFGVSADELLCLGQSDKEKRRAEINKAYDDTFKTGSIPDRLEIMQNAVAEFPGDMDYLTKLAWCEACYSFNFPDEETYTEWLDKAIKHFETAIENSTDSAVLHSALWGIVQYLSIRGKRDEAKKYFELFEKEFPYDLENIRNFKSMYMTGDERRENNQKNVLSALYSLLKQFETLNSEAADNVSLDILKIVFPDENYKEFNDLMSFIFRRKAQRQIKRGEFDDAVRSLEKQLYHAAEYDKIYIDNNGVFSYSSSLFDKVKIDTKEWCKPGDTTFTEDFFEMLEKRPWLDPIRDRNDFKELLAKKASY